MLATSLSRSSRSPRKSRCSMTLIAESGVRPRVSPSTRCAHGRRQAIGQRLGKARRQQFALESGKEERVGQLVERQQIVAATDHLGELGPAGLRWHRPAGAAQRPGRQLRRGHLQVPRHPGGAPRPALQHRQVAVGGVAAEEFVAARARQRHGEPGGRGWRATCSRRSARRRSAGPGCPAPPPGSRRSAPPSARTSWCWVPMAAAICLAMGPR